MNKNNHGEENDDDNDDFIWDRSRISANWNANCE